MCNTPRVVASIDLGTENLGLWVGRAWFEDGGGHESKHPVGLDPRDNRTLTCRVGRRTFFADTVLWAKVSLLEDFPVTFRTVKKKTGVLERYKVKPPMQEHVAHAMAPKADGTPGPIPWVIAAIRAAGAEEVLIETQLTNMSNHAANRGQDTAGNLTMKVMSHVLQALLHQALPRATVAFVSGAATIPLCDAVVWEPGSTWAAVLGVTPEPKGSSRNKHYKKMLAVRTAKYLWAVVDPGKASPHHAAFLAARTTTGKLKQDDMADALLQVWAHMRTAKPTNPKPAPKPPQKRTKPRIDTAPAEGMSMAAMKKHLSAWKCRGYSSLKRDALEEFYCAALEHRNNRKPHQPATPL